MATPVKTRDGLDGPITEGLTAVASDGDILTRRGVNDLQRLAGNQATGSLLDSKRTLQRQPEEGEGVELSNEAVAAAPEDWEGSVKGNLPNSGSVYHTLNNVGDDQLQYVLRIHSRGDAMVSLETQYEYKTTGLQKAWIALYVQGGKTEEVTNGLPPHSSLHLRFFGERDYTNKGTYFEGTAEVRRKK